MLKVIFCLAGVTTLSRYNSDIHESILIIFGSNVTKKVGNQKYFNFPLHQTSASALPGETGNLENASFMLLAFYQKRETRVGLKSDGTTGQTTGHLAARGSASRYMARRKATRQETELTTV